MDGDLLRRLVDEVAEQFGGRAEVQLDEVEECDPYWEPGPDGTAPASVRHSYVVHVHSDLPDVSETVFGAVRQRMGAEWQIAERPVGETYAVDFTGRDGTFLGVVFDPKGNGPIVVIGRTANS
ncbi:hypothetical protein Aph01nite_39880 [Acrocarpospora phusangensis]|uniref:Uncharacterized protein n=1 Tax=Acrocarpospora phusangensis TaxID=1070424 RepID=A0A919QDX2_9ACTN|nr:hypothetical protein [Acrocarpospora phusangensis]GIH25678.1 hypothetical protein Aph01nite_39880 [Acrocarpospora phusangensis]